MGNQDHPGALAGEGFERRTQGLDAGGIRNAAVLHGNVEVGPEQDAFAGHVEIVEGSEIAHPVSIPLRANMGWNALL